MKKILLMAAVSLLLATGALGAFPDNPEGTWYHEAIAYAGEAGWIKGYSDGGAHPEALVTKEQAITIIARVRGHEPAGSGGFWSAGYVDRGVMEGYVRSREDLEKPISREDTAEMIYLAYRVDGMAMPVGASPFSDVDSEAVTALSQLGVITGAGDGLFLPQAQLSRAQLCAMLMRAEENQRVQRYLAGEEEGAFAIHTEYLLTLPDGYDMTLADDAAMVEAYTYLCLSGESGIRIAIPGTREEAAEKSERLGVVIAELGWRYPEYFGLYKGYSLQLQQESPGVWSGMLLLTLPDGMTAEGAVAKRDLLLREVNRMVLSLFDDGTLKKGMTQTEMAKALAGYIAAAASYDKNAGGSSHYGADFFADGTLVCDGYTSLYDLALRYLGVQCFGRAGRVGSVNHIWTMACLDGAWKAVDLTYMDKADSPDGVDYSYFAVEEADLLSRTPRRTEWPMTLPFPEP